MLSKFLCVIGSLIGALSVVGGAVGAHVIKPKLDSVSAASYDTAIHYALLHAVMLVVVGWMLKEGGGIALKLSGFGFLFGVVLFSGTILVRTTTNMSWPVPTAPFGGVLLISSWLLLAIANLIDSV